jgi:hypothetical protein
VAPEKIDEIGAFANRKEEKPVKFKLPGIVDDRPRDPKHFASAPTFKAAVHETIRLNSGEKFQGQFGHHCNEDVTKYLTEMVLALREGIP